MQLHTVTELLGIANYKVSHMISHSESSIGLVLQRIKDDPCICSGCGKAHGTSVHSTAVRNASTFLPASW